MIAYRLSAELLYYLPQFGIVRLSIEGGYRVAVVTRGEVWMIVHREIHGYGYVRVLAEATED